MADMRSGSRFAEGGPRPATENQAPFWAGIPECPEMVLATPWLRLCLKTHVNWENSGVKSLHFTTGCSDQPLDAADADAVVGRKVTLPDAGSECGDQCGSLVGRDASMQWTRNMSRSVFNREFGRLPGSPRRA